MNFLKPIKNMKHSSKFPVNLKQNKFKETTYRYIIENCLKRRRTSLNVLRDQERENTLPELLYSWLTVQWEWLKPEYNALIYFKCQREKVNLEFYKYQKYPSKIKQSKDTDLRVWNNSFPANSHKKCILGTMPQIEGKWLKIILQQCSKE